MGLLIRKDLIQSTETMKTGWSLCFIAKVENKAGSKDANFTNTTVTFEAISGPGNTEENAGRTIRHMISGKAVETCVAIVAERLLQLIQALTGITDRNELEGEEYELSTFMGRKVWVEVQMELNKQDGKTYPACIGFMPETEQPF